MTRQHKYISDVEAALRAVEDLLRPVNNHADNTEAEDHLEDLEGALKDARCHLDFARAAIDEQHAPQWDDEEHRLGTVESGVNTGER